MATTRADLIAAENATLATEVRELGRGEEAEWNAFVEGCAWGTPFHLHQWQAVVKTVLGHDSIGLTARRGGRITGVFPMSRVRNRIFGDCLVSMPLAVYGGICAADVESY